MNKNDLQTDCPVCLESFSPPIFQCNNGHLICNSCVERCDRCPVCRESLPDRKIRNLQFEKMIASLPKTKVKASGPVTCPCPRKNEGCTAMLSKDEVKDHKLDCPFVWKKFCSKLGLSCNQENSVSKLNEMIEHFEFDHELQGSSDDSTTTGTGRRVGNSSISKMNLVQKCKRSELYQYLTLQSSKPNFIKFGGKIFFVIKKVNAAEKVLSIMVCIDASSKTATKYSAIIQLIPAKSAGPTFKFKQEEMALLSELRAFDNDKICENKHCKVPIATIEKMGGGQGQNLGWKFVVSVSKEPAPSGSATTSTSTRVNVKPSSTSTPGSRQPTPSNHHQITIRSQGSTSAPNPPFPTVSVSVRTPTTHSVRLQRTNPMVTPQSGRCPRQPTSSDPRRGHQEGRRPGISAPIGFERSGGSVLEHALLLARSPM